MGKARREDVPGCSRTVDTPSAGERLGVDGALQAQDGRPLVGDGGLRQHGEQQLGGGSRQLPQDDQSTGQGCKRRKTGIQMLAARRDAERERDLHVKATCSGSIAKVCDLFDTFDAEKRDLVEEIGFLGMLGLPSNTEPDPRVCLWLMRSVETSDRPGLCLHTRNVSGITCRDVDVHFILGVPFEGTEIELGQPVQGKIVKVVRKLLHISVCGFPISMAEVRQVLLKNYGTRMSHVQRASFRIAVVLYAVTIFLAPSCCNPEFANTEVLKHLLDPDRIKEVNWADYIIKCIKRESCRLKDELCDGRSSVIINSCPAVLQIFYLDNLAFGPLSLVHDLFPRIGVYTSEKIRLLTEADTKKHFMSSLDMYGITKVRQKTDVCYSRGFGSRSLNKSVLEQMPNVRTENRIYESDMSSEISEMTHEGLNLIDQYGIKLSELLKQVAGVEGLKLIDETFDNMRSQWLSYSVEKQERRLRAANTSNGFVGESSSSNCAGNYNEMGSLKVKSGKLVLERVATEESWRANRADQDGVGLWGGLNEYNDDGQHSVLTPEQRAFFSTPADPILTDGPPVYDSTPPSRNAGHGSPGLFAGGAEMDHDEDIDEPFVPQEYDVINVASHSQFGASPFSLGLFHSKASPSLCRNLMKMVDKTDAVEALRTWVKHNEPTELAITCSDLRIVFSREGRYTVLVVDGLTRCYQIRDRVMYANSGVPDHMWRHWMPASFATAVVDGEDFLSPRFRDMFVGEHLGYNIANCRMLYMFLPRNGRWCSYVWDFLKKVISVLDPCLQQSSVDKMQWEHDETMDLLHQALFDCKDAWIEGWEVDRHNWEFNHPIALGRRCRDYNSGVYTMHYALHYDADDVTDLSVEADHVLVRGDQFYQLLTIPGNNGDLPAFLPMLAG